MLDALRAADWMTRSARARVRVLRDAGQDLGRSEAELARETGLTIQQIREAAVAATRRPVYLEEGGVPDVPGPQAVEDQVFVSGVLAEVVSQCRRLPDAVQVVLVLRYYAGREFSEIAGLLGMTEAEVSQAHADGVTTVHGAMLRVVALCAG